MISITYIQIIYVHISLLKYVIHLITRQHKIVFFFAIPGPEKNADSAKTTSKSGKKIQILNLS